MTAADPSPNSCGTPGWVSTTPQASAAVSINQDMRLAFEWLHCKARRALRPFHLPVCWKLEGEVDAGSLERALNELVRRHQGLRAGYPDLTRLTRENEQMLFANLQERDGWRTRFFQQELWEDAPLELACRSVSGGAIDARHEGVAAIFREEAAKLFAYDRPPLVRATLVTASGHGHALILVFHHLVADLHSVGVFIRELGALYRCFVEARDGSCVEAPRTTYADYVRWQRSAAVDTGEADRIALLQRCYEEWVSEEPHAADVKTLAPESVCDAETASVRVLCEPRVSTGLLSFCRRIHVTPYVLFLSALSVVWSCLANRSRIAVWSMWANRLVPDSGGLIGWLAERRLLGIVVDESATSRHFLETIRGIVWNAGSFQYLPAGAVEFVAWRRPPAETAAGTIHLGIDMSYRFLAEPTQWSDDLSVAPIRFPHLSRDRSIKVIVRATQEISLECVYPTDMISMRGAQRVLEQLVDAATGLAAEPDRAVGVHRQRAVRRA